MKTIKIKQFTLILFFSLFFYTSFCQNDISAKLLDAVKKSDIEQVKKLVEQGADVNIKDSNGLSLLHYAVYEDDTILIELFIKKGIDVNIKDNEGRTPLYYAIFLCNQEMAINLIQKGADVNIGNNEGESPLAISIRRHYNELSDYLKTKGAIKKEKKEKLEFIIPIGNSTTVNSVSFSPDQKYVFLGSSNESKVYEFSSGKLIQTLRGNGELSKDWNYFLTTYNKILYLWETSSGKLIKTFKGHKELIQSYCLSDDMKYALSEADDKTLRLWDISSGKLFKTIKTHHSMGSEVCFSSDNKYALYFFDVGFYGRLKLIDISKGEIVKRYKRHNWYISSLGISPDNKYAATGSDLGKINLREIEKGKIIKTFRMGYVESVCFSPNSKYLLASFKFSEDQGSDINSLDTSFKIPSIELLEISSGKSIKTFGMHTYGLLTKDIGSACFSPDSRYILAGSGDLWDVTSGKLIKSFKGHSVEVNTVCFSPDGKFTLSAHNNSIKLWDISEGRLINTFKGHNGKINSVCFSPDGRYALSGSNDKTIKLWEIASGKLIKNFKGHTDKVISVCFSPDGKYAISGSLDETSKLWDISNRKLIKSFEGKKKKFETIVRIGKLNLSFVRDINFISVSFSPDGKNILSVINKNLKIWEIESGKLINSFKNINDDQRKNSPICFSPNGKYALYVSQDTTLKLCEIESGKLIKTFEGQMEPAFICFSMDGKLAAAVTEDKTIKLLDISSGKLVKTFEGHSGKINSVNFSPDGKSLISGSEDNTMKIWDINIGKEIATLISLDSTEWVVTTPSGLFDASPGAMKLMHYTVGMDIIDLDQIKQRYYQPNLLPVLLGYSQDKLREVPAFENIRMYPEIQLTINPDTIGKQLTIINQKPEVGGQKSDTEGILEIKLKNRGGGIGKVGVYLDNIELTDDARVSPADSSKEELIINLDLSKYASRFRYDTANIIKVIAYNAENYIASRPAYISYSTKMKGIKGVPLFEMTNEEKIQHSPHLWGLFIGVSDYAGTGIDLAFAAKDAEDIANAVSLGASGMFGKDKTNIICLNTDTGIDSLQPTTKNIEKYLQRFSKASPQDIIVLYFSGHGVNYGGQDGDFYFLTAGASSNDAEYLKDPSIRKQYTLSSSDLTNLINQIPARKKVLILDACSSGKAAEKIDLAMKDVPASQIRALDRMQDKTGFFILAGSAANASSYETSMYGQGLLTYALLKGMKGDKLRLDGGEEYIDIRPLFQYAEDKVPELAKNIGGIQTPFFRSPDVTGSFDIGRMTKEDKEKIILAEPKPMIMPVTFQDRNQLEDVLGLTDKLNAQLRDLASKGKQAPIAFSEGNYPDAYKVSGLYKISNENISVEFKIKSGSTIIANNLNIKGYTKNLDELVVKLIDEIRKTVNNKK